MLQIIKKKLNFNLDRCIFNELLGTLNEYEQKNILKYRKYEDSLRSLFGKIILKEALGLDKLNLAYNEWGKPYLIGMNETHFNITHSEEWVAVAISENPVGIDIQYINDIDLTIAKRFFSKDESEYIFSLPESERRDAFFKLWTLKEAFIKSEGKGMFIALDSFFIDIRGKKPILSCSTDHYFYNMSIEKLEDNYFLATCDKINVV